LFDFSSFTVVEDFLRILGDYVKQQLELTAWLAKQSCARLLSARFVTYKLQDTGKAHVCKGYPVLQWQPGSV
jgi:hypothetical protein